MGIRNNIGKSVLLLLYVFLCLEAYGQSSGTVSVPATANPWRAGGFVLPDDPGGFGIGDVPPEITFAAGLSTKITISAAGSWSCGLASAGPAGGLCGPFPNVNVFAIGGISGIQISQMTLVGVFLDSANPPNVIIGNGIGNVFAIGTGGTFDIPATATRLILGMPDECTGGGSGSTASCYGDNSGAVTVNYELTRQFHISFSGFIMPPIIPPFGDRPGPGICLTLPPQREFQRLRYSGDNRDFDPNPSVGAYRVHQEIVVDQAGKIVSDGFNDTGISKSWAPDSFDSNHALTPEALSDAILGDCHLLHGEATASTENMQINVTPVSDDSFTINFKGKAADPLFIGANILAPVEWNIQLAIDSGANPPKFKLTGFHTCYPAIELYVTDVASKKVTSLIQFAPGGNNIGTLFACLTGGAFLQTGHKTYDKAGRIN
jgi:hypothetical protein